MKHLLIILMSFTLKSFGQTSPFFSHYRDFRGDVKSIYLTSFRAKCYFGEISAGEKDLGNWEDSRGTYDFERLVKFDTLGNEIIDIRYDSDKCVCDNETFNYDTHNNVVYRGRYPIADSICQMGFTKYDFKFFFINNYNPSNQLVSIMCLDRNKDTISTISFTYDNLGYIKSKRQVNLKSEYSKIEIDSFFCNTKGEIIKSKSHYDWRGETSYYTHDSKGQLIREEKKDEKNELVNLTLYKYNEIGDVTEELSYNCYGFFNEKKEFNYDYDKKNNWIKRVEYINSKPLYVIFRKIDYWH